MRSDVSVVTPTYNGAVFIGSHLESILTQTQAPAEIVVVDDHSTDETPDLVSAIAEKSAVPIRLIRLSQNSGGPSRPLNIGIEAAQCEYVALLDQDDLMRPGRIEAQRRALDSCPQCNIVVGGFSIIGYPEDDMTQMWPVSQFDGLESQIGKSHYSIIDSETAFKVLLGRNFAGSMSGFCFTKETFRRLGKFDETIYTCVDLDFLLRATIAGPIAIVNEKVFDYRWSSDSLHRQNMTRSLLETTMVRLRAASQKPEWAGDDLKSLRHSALVLANKALKQGDIRAIRLLREILLKYKGLQVVRNSINNKTRRLIGPPSR